MSFQGTTRNEFENKSVLELEYEAYESMALKEMLRVCNRAKERFPGLVRVLIEHKLGSCPVMDTSLIVIVSSPHRGDALQSVAFIVDDLKKNVPIWKLVGFVFPFICIYIYSLVNTNFVCVQKQGEIRQWRIFVEGK